MNARLLPVWNARLFSHKLNVTLFSGERALLRAEAATVQLLSSRCMAALTMGREFEDQGTNQEAKELVGAVSLSAVCRTGAGLSCLE